VHLSLESQAIYIEESDIQMDKKMERIQKILITLIHSSLSRLEIELKKYDLDEEIFKIETVLSGRYSGAIQAELKKEFQDLGFKARQILKDINELKSLLNLLLDSDAINFHMKILDTREIDSPYSIFKHPDDESDKLIKEMTKTNVERIYTIEKRGKGLELSDGKETFKI
jgi:hypothetical protein